MLYFKSGTVMNKFGNDLQQNFIKAAKIWHNILFAYLFCFWNIQIFTLIFP